jgi:hypothetical protein
MDAHMNLVVLEDNQLATHDCGEDRRNQANQKKRNWATSQYIIMYGLLSSFSIDFKRLLYQLHGSRSWECWK